MKSAQSLESAYDVIVAGAGPAGGECARELAKSGINTLLLERARVVGEPNFSSGGTVKETMEKFELPKSIIQQYVLSLPLTVGALLAGDGAHIVGPCR